MDLSHLNAFYTAKSIDDTHDVARVVLDSIAFDTPDSATVIALSGNLGAGKTTFTQCLCKHLGVLEQVVSPTYVIMKSYRVNKKESRFTKVIHMDAYRLKSESDVDMLGWQQEVHIPNNLFIIEWPEVIKHILPKSTIYITIETINDYTRTFDIRG